jgi:hypothetical protein
MVYEYGEQVWNDIDRERPNNSEDTCSSASLSTTNYTWTDTDANPGLRLERPVNNRLSNEEGRWRKMSFPGFLTGFNTSPRNFIVLYPEDDNEIARNYKYCNYRFARNISNPE